MNLDRLQKNANITLNAVLMVGVLGLLVTGWPAQLFSVTIPYSWTVLVAWILIGTFLSVFSINKKDPWWVTFVFVVIWPARLF